MQISGAAPLGAHGGNTRPFDAVQPAATDTLRFAQMNMWNLFDTVNDPNTADDDSTPTPAQYQVKLGKIATAIATLGLPDVVSMNEVENDTVVRDLLAQPQLKAAGYDYVIEQSNDGRGITVGMLYKRDKLEKVAVDTPNPAMSFPDSGRGQIDPSLLYARAPLVVDFRLRGADQAVDGSKLLTVAVNHFKSKLGGSGPEERRQMQGKYLGDYLEAKAAKDGAAQIVLGDLNSGYGEGAYEKLTTGADGSKRFYDAPLKLNDSDRYTYIYKGHKEMLDHLMVSNANADAISAVQILHVNTAVDGRSKKWDPTTIAGYSDHDPTIVDFSVDKLFS